MKKILLFTLCFFVLSCSTREKKSKTSFTIIPMTNINFDSKLKMSEFVESIEAIPLETTPESLIGEIKHIKKYTLDRSIYGISVDEERGIIIATDVNSDEPIIEFKLI